MNFPQHASPERSLAMTEENNNQPAIPPNDYQNHLIWRNIFVYIILPYQFIVNIISFYQFIYDFNEYLFFDKLFMLFGYTITLISIPIVFFASIKKRPIGYKTIGVYSIFLIIYKITNSIRVLILINYLKQMHPAIINEITFNSILGEILYTLFYIAIAIINLIYFSHRKFLFGIPDEKSTTPAPEQEPKENHQ